MTFRRIGLSVLIAAVAGYAGCSSSDENNGGTTGGSGGGASGSNTGGSSTGGTSIGGNGNGGSSTGGSSTSARPPHTEDFDCSEPSGDLPPLRLAEVASGFDRPIFVTQYPGVPNRLVVVEQRGPIRFIEDGVTSDPWLNLTDLTWPYDGPGYSLERGLFSIAFHPNFESNGRFYVHFSASNGFAGELDDVSGGDTIIAEYTVSDDGSVDPDSRRILLTVSQFAENHNGGAIAFGSDNLLYIALGDGGGGSDPQGNGQDPSTLLGAILRIDVDADDAGEYGIPTGNLQETIANAAPEVWSYGLRNPFRMTFDGCTGDLYIGDVGQNCREEINVEPAGDGRKNYGWPIMDGNLCLPSPANACDNPPSCDSTGLTMPVIDFTNSGNSSVISGYVYRGSAIPALRGTYFYADWGTGRIWTLRWNGSEAQDVTEVTNDLGNPGSGIVSFGQDAQGELYVVRATDSTGIVYRLEVDDGD